MDKKLNTLAEMLFNEDCKKENLLWKLDLFNEKILEIKQRILHTTGYPNNIEVYDVGPYVIRVGSRDVEVFTAEQYEKIEGDYEND